MDVLLHLFNAHGSLGVTEDCRGNMGNTLLHFAAKSGNVELIKYLLDNGIGPNVQNDMTETPLHMAAEAYLRGMCLILFYV